MTEQFISYKKRKTRSAKMIYRINFFQKGFEDIEAFLFKI